ncbi:hypothetical protein C4O09_004433 [Salmonella enterica subsp. enterica serovar Minnesota]|nr:hypothetical protein [Salmonella enterica subsp. enterica serovar Minnesota]
MIIVTTSIIKSGTTPGLWPGVASLFSGGIELDVSFVIRSQGPAALRWEVLLLFPNRRGRESAARAGLFRLSTGQAVNRLCF